MKYLGNVLFCDNHILVAIKPAGWLTQKDETSTIDLETVMKQYLKEKFAKKGNVFLHVVHRLDRPVGGLVLFARTSKALSRLNVASRNGDIRRMYEADVEGKIEKQKGKLEHHLIHGSHHAIVSSKEKGKKAELDYWVKSYGDRTTHVCIELKTGRYHQIRAQFASFGHPIVGDIRYGAKKGDGHSIRLHATTLIFPHPITGEELSFHSEF